MQVCHIFYMKGMKRGGNVADGKNRSPNVQSVHENQRLRERKGQSHRLNKSKPVQRGQTMCSKRQYFQTPSCERPL